MQATETIHQYIERRITELKAADAAFCTDRWDMTKMQFERNLARDMSNQVTFARQELERLLTAFPPLAQTVPVENTMPATGHPDLSKNGPPALT